MIMEIERKYLIPEIPSGLDIQKTRVIEQGYLCTAPVVRIRRDNDDYILTYKSKGLMEREEYNLPLTREAYEHLKAKIDGRLIEKVRHVIPLEEGLFIELDVFKETWRLLCWRRWSFPPGRWQRTSARRTGSGKM